MNLDSKYLALVTANRPTNSGMETSTANLQNQALMYTHTMPITLIEPQRLGQVRFYYLVK